MLKEKPKLAISLVTHNAEKYLPFCLNSILGQNFQDFNILIIDNGSSDGTVRLLREEYPQIKIVEHPDNIGFAKAHNQAISWTDSDYIMLLNQDVILEPDYLKKTISYLDSHQETAALSGKVLIWNFADNQKTKIIDSLGLKILKNHRVIEIGQGEKDKGQFNELKEVFGVSGALPIYRRTSLESIKIKVLGGLTHEEYFDEDFFSYKEDVDLAFRLRLFGHKSVYLPEAVAYHDRSVKGKRDLSDKAIRLSRKEKDKMIKMYSYKNHLLMLIKNEFSQNFIKYFFPIFWFELKKLIFILFFENSTLKGLKMFFRQRRKILQKRKYIVENIRKVGPEELGKWFE